MRVFCTKNGRSPTIEILNDAGTAIFYMRYVLQSTAVEIAVDEFQHLLLVACNFGTEGTVAV